jgi:hypothetical protein
MNRAFRTIAGTACAILGAAACYDLSVGTTDDTLTREFVLSDPSLVERVIAGVGINLWGGMNNTRPWVALSALGEEITSSSSSASLWDIGREPRPALDNAPGVASINRDPWANFYEANSTATEMSRNIKARGLRLIDKTTGADNTSRGLAYAKFIQGSSHAYLSMLFDKAAIVNEEVDLSEVPDLEFQPHTVVRDSAIKWLEEAITLANAAPFNFPYTDALWFYNNVVSNGEFAQLSHSMIARTIVYNARNPAERAALDWGTVKFHIENGLNFDFGLGADGTRPNPLLDFGYKVFTGAPPTTGTGTSNSNSTRVDLRLLGPGDTTTILVNGVRKTQYQAWLEKVDNAALRDTVKPFIINSPDQRILRSGQTVPVGKPVVFQFTSVAVPTTAQPTERGAYYQSNYWSASRTKNGLNSTGNLDDIRDIAFTKTEMNLLLAEAEYRLGNKQRAADLINNTRVGNGGLDSVLVSGPPQATAAEVARCVPRRYDGSCGDLWDALMYEKRIETFGVHGMIPYGDARGWGCLLEGSVTELPIPGRQLDLLGFPVYTFGGQPGQAGSAPMPSGQCPIIVNHIVRAGGG